MTAAPVEPTRFRRIIAALIGLELLKHLALLSLGLAQPWGDSGPYWQLAGDAAHGDIWLAVSQQAFRTPGYPWLLAIFRFLGGPVALAAALIAQHLVVMLTSLATAMLARQVTKSDGATLLAWLLCALSTARPLYANWILTESWATLLLTVAVLQIVRAVDERRSGHLILASCCLAAGVLVRPSLLAAAPALLAAGWMCGQTLVGRCKLALLGPALLAVCLVPWCLRNASQFDRFALTIFTGRELWTAHFSPWPGGELEVPTDGPGGELRSRIGTSDIDLRHNWSVSYALQKSGLNDAEVDALMERVAWQAIGNNPGRAAFRTLARCATFWYVREWEIELRYDGMSEQTPNFYPTQRRWMTSPLQATVIAALKFTPERWFPAMWVWSIVTWAGIASLMIRHNSRAAGTILGLVLLTTTVLTAGLEIPLYRYRCVLEPFMVATTAVAVHFLGSLRSQHRPASP